ncbi:MFS transporter [Paractinoplanes globisporus]|uniref:MFS transporter n=1 Tax=Paractinoplanes globisporus TaxID=113565 RepID=A0ABW6W845_9ACTN|nr:MFS transporter [Actinoplanes globisporus]
MAVPAVLRHRDFDLYWFGVVFSQIGTRGTVAANLFQVYELSRSIALTGLVGFAQAISLLVLSPLGGAYADRLDRRRLLQATQLLALAVALGLGIVTEAGHANVAEVLIAVVLTTAAGTFDQPARQALIPAMVPRNQLAQAFALINPSRELAVLIGPALAGLLIAVHGPGLMYLADAATYAVLVVVLGMLRVPRLMPAKHLPVLHSIAEGARFVAKRPTIWMMMSLDLSATLFGAYRVVLPALTLTVLHAGPTAYGLLSSAPSAGALLATWPVVHLVGRPGRTGRVLLAASAGYGVATLALAQSQLLLLALLAGLLVGAFDALATTIRQAAVQLETPDEIRGRVSSIYQMASRGGPALGDTIIGGLASLLGPVAALSLGSLVPIGYAAGLWLRGSRLRDYRTVPEPDPAVMSP